MCSKEQSVQVPAQGQAQEHPGGKGASVGHFFPWRGITFGLGSAKMIKVGWHPDKLWQLFTTSVTLHLGSLNLCFPIYKVGRLSPTSQARGGKGQVWKTISVSGFQILNPTQGSIWWNLHLSSEKKKKSCKVAKCLLGGRGTVLFFFFSLRLSTSCFLSVELPFLKKCWW